MVPRAVIARHRSCRNIPIRTCSLMRQRRLDSQLHECMPATRTSRHVIGVDVGGTKIAVGIVKFPGGRLIAHRVIPTEAHRGGGAVLDRLMAVLQELTASAKVKPVGLGIGLCELVSPDGKINSQATLNWSSQQLRKRLKGFGPVTIEADVRAAALAEAMFGGGRKYRNFLFVTVG